MTKFDCYIEKMLTRRQAEQEKTIDEWLYQSLTTRTKSEVVRDLTGGLFFRVKTGVCWQKEAVFS